MKRKDILEKGALVQRDGETFAVTPRIPCGLITDFDILRKMADVADKYNAKAIKVTSAQRITIIGLQEDDLDAAWKDLGMEPGMASGLCIRNVKACPGTTYCKLGQQDALSLGLILEERFVHRQTPNKVKIAVSGCPLDCAEGHVRDIGILANRKGFIVEVGGSAGADPRLAEVIASGLNAEEVETLVGRILDVYEGFGKKKRLGQLIDAIGLETFKEKLGLK